MQVMNFRNQIVKLELSQNSGSFIELSVKVLSGFWFRDPNETILDDGASLTVRATNSKGETALANFAVSNLPSANHLEFDRQL